MRKFSQKIPSLPDTALKVYSSGAPPVGGSRQSNSNESLSDFKRKARFWAKIKRIDLERRLAMVLVAVAIPLAIITFFMIQRAVSAEVSSSTILWLLTADLGVLLLLMVIIAKQVISLWVQRKKGLAGAKLHTRLVFWFSALAIIPSVIVTIFTTLFLNFGLNQWFNDSVKEAVYNSLVVAHEYLLEHQRSIVGDILAMANDLKYEGPLFEANPKRIQNFILLQSSVRSLSEVLLLNGQGKVLAAGNLSLTAALNPDVSPSAFERARNGETIILSGPTEDRIRAMVLVDWQNDIYLYIGRKIDVRILGYVEETSKAVELYKNMEGRRFQIQVTFALIFIVIASLALMGAIWVALVFSGKLFKPITQLIAAAEKIGHGDLNTRVPYLGGVDEINILNRTFNQMTERLSLQQQELVTKNIEVNERRQFTELVLQGVSAGVVGISEDGTINLINQSAIHLLELDSNQFLGSHFSEIFPEIKEFFEAIQSSSRYETVKGQIEIERRNVKRTFTTKMVRNGTTVNNHGYVLTFDDISSLLVAQRKAAWADVARRIAHEVKNPLTPIQLSAERLKRRYQKYITSDLDIFDQCIDTIVNQVDTIKRLIDEFSAFARMPTPIFQYENLVNVCKQAVFLQSQGRQDIIFATYFPEPMIMMKIDSRQIGQALTNVLLNAVQAIEKRRQQKPDSEPGHIALTVGMTSNKIVITVEDNGCGLPEKYLNILTEPYVTTKANGNGLGLAIVRKIVEDHKGILKLGNKDGNKTLVEFEFDKQENMLLD